MSPKNKGKFGKGKPAVELEDEFVSGVAKLGRRLRPYAVQLAVAGGVILVAVVAVATYGWWQDRKATRATAIYARAVELADRPVEPPPADGAEGEDAADGADAAGAADGAGGAAAGEPAAFASEAERAQAVLAALDELQRDYGSTDAARAARLLRAKTLLALGRPGDALAVYQSSRADASSPALQLMAQEGIGYAHEAAAAAAGDAAARQAALEQALEAFRQIQPAEQGPFKEYALYHEARILSALDRRDEAIAALEKAAALEDSALTGDIESRLALLHGAAAE